MSNYVKQNGHVAIVTINRPDRMNALGQEVRHGLIE
jgi:enoyl-CoA hydratase/carnithine racemase